MQTHSPCEIIVRDHRPGGGAGGGSLIIFDQIGVAASAKLSELLAARKEAHDPNLTSRWRGGRRKLHIMRRRAQQNANTEAVANKAVGEDDTVNELQEEADDVASSSGGIVESDDEHGHLTSSPGKFGAMSSRQTGVSRVDRVQVRRTSANEKGDWHTAYDGKLDAQEDGNNSDGTRRTLYDASDSRSVMYDADQAAHEPRVCIDVVLGPTSGGVFPRFRRCVPVLVSVGGIETKHLVRGFSVAVPVGASLRRFRQIMEDTLDAMDDGRLHAGHHGGLGWSSQSDDDDKGKGGIGDARARRGRHLKRMNRYDLRKLCLQHDSTKSFQFVHHGRFVTPEREGT